MRILTLVITLFTACTAGEGPASPLVAGIYWDGAATLSAQGGLFTLSVNTAIGASGESVCQFHCDGEVVGKSFTIHCQNYVDPGIIDGTVTLQNDTTALLKMVENPGCSERIADFVNEGKNLLLHTSLSLVQVRTVKAGKAFFHSKPDAAKKRKAYLVHGDEARVIDKKIGWLKVSFKNTTGWIQESDMFPLHSVHPTPEPK